jgi:hypothetical protein
MDVPTALEWVSTEPDAAQAGELRDDLHSPVRERVAPDPRPGLNSQVLNSKVSKLSRA